jgi:hypothetical protein
MKKIIIIFSLIVLGLIGLMFLGKGQQKNTNSSLDSNLSNLLTPSEMMYDFGNISMKDGLATHIFQVQNLSEQDVNLSKLYTSCMCTEAYLIQSDGNKIGPFGMQGMGFMPKVNEVIKTGDSRDIEVVYDPNAHGPAGVGVINRFILLEDSNGGELQLEVRANVTP